MRRSAAVAVAVAVVVVAVAVVVVAVAVAVVVVVVVVVVVTCGLYGVLVPSGHKQPDSHDEDTRTLAPFRGTPMHSEGGRHPQAGTTGKAELPGDHWDHSLTPRPPEHHARARRHARNEITLTCLTPSAMRVGYW